MSYDYDAASAALGVFGGMMIGVAIFALIIAIAIYVVSSLAYMKAMKMSGYAYPVAAWVPFWRDYAIADTACAGQDPVSLFGLSCPALLLKLYWLITLALSFVLNGSSVGNILVYIVNALFLAQIFTTLFARFEGKEEADCRVIGIVSGLLPIVAWVKFLMHKPQA